MADLIPDLIISHGIWQDWKRLVSYLEMDSKKDLNAFIAGPLFEPAFNELFQAIIEPAQKEAERLKKPRIREPELRTVQQTYIYGKKNGKRRYSRSRPNKSD